MVWSRCFLHVSRVLSPPPPNCCATRFYPKSADNHYLLLVKVARGWKTFVGRSLGHHRGHSSPTPRAEQTLPTCFRVREETRLVTGMSLKMNLIQLNPGHLSAGWSLVTIWVFTWKQAWLFHSWILQKGCQDHSAIRRMFRQHFCLLFAAKATWCMRLILCRQAATNLLG